ncbi:cupin domain-containing protein [Natrarchaeobius sp. A-rgal3]|uniref:cupin domain-containing protein n=1 Tax=Natrarchaeobius versutus TaxID=1679078 RepID=UPI00350F7366
MSEKHFVRSENVSTQQLDWGTIKWMSKPGVTDAERFSAGVVFLQPGKGHDLHTHPDSEEVLYIISGEGEQTVAGDTREVGQGDMIHIPADVEHGTQNTGWEPLKFLAIYSPPGPEEEVGALPECEILPPGELPVREE